jgi:pimeloyl-ACP methyl ester carboxylesterase
MVAWSFAFSKPHLLDKLVILNLPHPRGIANVVASNPTARANTNYAQVFRQKSASDPEVFFGGPMNVNSLSGWVTDQDAKIRYQEAFAQSDFDGMLNYYKANYPPPPAPDAPSPPAPPIVTSPVLIFHGLKDTALHSDGLNNTWDWVDKDVTIVSAPNAGHFVQQDAAELVTTTMKWWLLAH